MLLRLVSEGSKKIPFQKDRIIEFAIGSLWNENDKRFRYTRSSVLIRARYRVTLQYSDDDEFTPFVFDVIRPEPGAPLDIRPDSDPARKVWMLQADPRRMELNEALTAIYEQDIEQAT